MPTSTAFKKGQKAGPGRPPGAQAIVTRQLKEMILSALDEAGGVEYLVKRANDPRTAAAFLGLIGKVLPMQLTGADGDPIAMSLKVEFVKQEAKP